MVPISVCEIKLEFTSIFGNYLKWVYIYIYIIVAVTKTFLRKS